MRECYACGNNKTRLYRGKYERWNLNKPTDLVLCDRCFDTIINKEKYLARKRQKQTRYRMRYPERIKQQNKDWRENNILKCKENSKKRITFLGKYLGLDFNPRKGKCQICGIQDITNMHHAEGYDINNPLYGTIELCHRCHALQHIQIHDSVGRFVRKRG